MANMKKGSESDGEFSRVGAIKHYADLSVLVVLYFVVYLINRYWRKRSSPNSLSNFYFDNDKRYSFETVVFENNLYVIVLCYRKVQLKGSVH